MELVHQLADVAAHVAGAVRAFIGGDRADALGPQRIGVSARPAGRQAPAEAATPGIRAPVRPARGLLQFRGRGHAVREPSLAERHSQYAFASASAMFVTGRSARSGGSL